MFQSEVETQRIEPKGRKTSEREGQEGAHTPVMRLANNRATKYTEH